MKNTLLIIGYGYTASYIAQLFSQNNCWHVIGTSRTQKPDDLIIPYERESIARSLKIATHVIISVPPDDQGDAVLNDFGDLFYEFESLKFPKLEWIGYLSATSVYGNHDGDLVNEESILKPSSARAINRIRAEEQWFELGQKYKITVNIFRLAGIYGPKRNAIEQVKNGSAKSIFKEGQMFSRIHVEDIAQIILAAVNMKDAKAQIYNLADDHPCATIDVNNYAAKLLGVEPPNVIAIEDAQLSEMAQEFYSDNKRICNRKIQELLKIKLKYPTYRQGLLTIYNGTLCN